MCQMSEKFYGNFFSTFSQSIKSRRSSNVSCMLGFDAGCLLPMIDARGGSEKLPTVSYVTSFWAETEDSTASPHRKEIQAAILSNINNRNFDQVVVLLDGITEHANCTHFIDEMYLLDRTHNLHVENENAIQKLTCINAPGRQLKYFQIFNYTLTDAVLGDVVVVSNADQAFDNTISKARHLSPSALAVLGTRGFSDATVPTDLQHFYDSLLDGYLKRNASQEEVDRCSTTPNSWDTFIFHRMMVKGKLQEADFLRMNVANESVPFYMNEYGAENAALWLWSGIRTSHTFTTLATRLVLGHFTSHRKCTSRAQRYGRLRQFTAESSWSQSLTGLPQSIQTVSSQGIASHLWHHWQT